jgi:hypothetical protein
MHESGVVRDLMHRVEVEIDGTQGRIAVLTFRVGVLSGVSPESLRGGVGRYALERWGLVPEIVVERVDVPTDPHALGVMLVSVGLEG